jgi:hypothetical protein
MKHELCENIAERLWYVAALVIVVRKGLMVV